MKENKIYHYATTLFELINVSKRMDKAKPDYNNNRVEILEKYYAIDKRLTHMFYDYILLCDQYKVRKFNELEEIDLREKFIIKDNSQSSFNIEELVDDLYVYYLDYARSNSIDFTINTQLDWVSLSMAKESFYQIIFSLIDSKLQFLGGEDFLHLNIEQKNDKLIISIQDNGFILTEAQIKKYSNQLVKRNNLFFLTWDELVNVLDFYKNHYQVKNKNKTNYIQVEFCIHEILFANQNQKYIK